MPSMSTFDSSFDEGTRLLVHRAIAPVTTDAVARCAVDWFERLGGREFHALWDLRGQRLDIDVSELTFGVNEHLAWVHEHRRGQRHAYLVETRVAVFLATPLKARVKVDWDIFDDEQCAREWLRTGEAQYRRPADPMNMKR